MDYTMKAVMKYLVLDLIVFCSMKGAATEENCDFHKVNKCFSASEFDMAVLYKDKTNFCSHQLRNLLQCLEAQNTKCFNEPQYQLNIQSFSPSMFGCEARRTGQLYTYKFKCWYMGIEGPLVVSVIFKRYKAVFLKLDLSTLATKLTSFCNIKLRNALSCVEAYKDVCSSGSHVRLFNAIVSTLQPELYGCSGSVREQCELFSVAGCIKRFNIHRMYHLEATGSSMYEESLCQHLRTAKGCIAPFELPCKNNPSFATINFKTYLDLNQCQATEKPSVVVYLHPVNHETSASAGAMVNNMIIALLLSVISGFINCTQS